MIDRPQLYALIATFLVIWWALSLWWGVALTQQLFAPVTPAIAATGVLLILFDRWIWRCPGIRQWFSRRPDIGGTWDVELRSSWIDPATQQPIPPIKAYMAIRQTYSRVSLRLMTKESSSETMCATIIRDDDGIYRVAVSYRNEPKVEHQHRSKMHLGAMLLAVHLDDAPSLSGTYWTERLTKGDIRLTARRRKLFHTFAAAASR